MFGLGKKTVPSTTTATAPDNSRLYKFMTEESEWDKINSSTLSSITFNDLVYYLAMPDKNKSTSSYPTTLDFTTVDKNPKKLLRDVLEKFMVKGLTSTEPNLIDAQGIVTALSESNALLTDLNSANVETKTGEILSLPVPPSSAASLSVVPTVADPAGTGGTVPTVTDPAGTGGPDPATAAAAAEAEMDANIDSLDEEFNGPRTTINSMVKDFKDTILPPLYDAIKNIKEPEPPAPGPNYYPDNQEFDQIRQSIVETIIDKNVEDILDQINIPKAAVVKLETFITEMARNEDDFPKTATGEEHQVLTKARLRLIEYKGIVAKYEEDFAIITEDKTKIESLREQINKIIQEDIKTIYNYYQIKNNELAFKAPRPTVEKVSQFKTYDETLKPLINGYISHIKEIPTSSVSYMADSENITSLATFLLNNFEVENEYIKWKFVDLNHKILGYNEIMEKYKIMIETGYTKPERATTRKELCVSIITYILNIFGNNGNYLKECFQFSHIEEPTQEWYISTFTTMRERTPTGDEDPLSLPTASADENIADLYKLNTSTDDIQTNTNLMISAINADSFKSTNFTGNWPSEYKLKMPVDLSTGQKCILFLFACLNNYNTDDPNEFKLLKWPFNRLILMIQEITGEFKRLGKGNDPSGIGGLNFGRTYAGGSKSFKKKLNKKTLKKKQLIRKKTHKK